MPIPFSLIPKDVQISIVQKQYVIDFVKFYQSSREAYEIAKNMKTKYVICVSMLIVDSSNQEGEVTCVTESSTKFYPPNFLLDYPLLEIRTALMSIEDPLSEVLCKKLTESPINTSMLQLSDSIDCTPESFNRMLASSKTQKLTCIYEVDKKFLRVQGMEKIDFLTAKSSVDNDDLHLHLRMPVMTLRHTDITNYGINQLIKEWQNGTRKITNIDIEINGPIQKKFILDDIQYEDQTILGATVTSVSSPHTDQRLSVILENSVVIARM